MIDNTDNMTLDELRQLARSTGSVGRFADAFNMLEQMERRTEELNQANEKLRQSLEESRKNRVELDSIDAIKKDLADIKAQGEKRITKEEIFAVKDTHKRLKLIEENMDLFQQ